MLFGAATKTEMEHDREINPVGYRARDDARRFRDDLRLLILCAYLLSVVLIKCRGYFVRCPRRRYLPSTVENLRRTMPLNCPSERVADHRGEKAVPWFVHQTIHLLVHGHSPMEANRQCDHSLVLRRTNSLRCRTRLKRMALMTYFDPLARRGDHH